MRFTKPSWVAHHDNHDPHKRMSIFSLSVHPDGSRVATGGLDAKIRIWSTSPIISQKAEEKGLHKSLSTLTMHTGPVLAVRWAASGKWLASGSDDTIVMIWDLDPNGGGKVWGSEDVNIEGWKALRRLTGHESDVVDCAWSPSDRYLASVGLDSKVFIWCGYTLECIRRLDGHQGFVKGVCWDPIGEYLATQSDDKTVNIWRSTDWRLETTVSKPYETSPGSAFFNRLSWSPDASYICTSNAMNSNAVFVAAVIERDTWNSNVSLVGHENTIQVAAYNPRLFRRDKTVPLPSVSPTKRTNYNESPSKQSQVNGSVDGDDDAAEEAANVYSVVALGADDRSISIWRTTDSRPLVVAKEAFDRQILDLSWSSDGKSVWACSADGSIAVLDFSDPEPDGMMGIGSRRKGEMDGLTTAEETKDYLKLFDFPWPPPLEANHMHMQQTNGYLPNARPQYQMDSYAPQPHYGHPVSTPYNMPQGSHGGSGMPPLVRPNYLTPAPSSMSASGGSGVAPPPINQAQKITLTKSGKKRIQPTFLGGGAGVITSSSAMPPPPMPSSSQAGMDGRMEWAPEGGHSSSSNRHAHMHPGSSSRQHTISSSSYPPDYGYPLAPGSRLPGSGESRVLAQPPNATSPRRYSSGTGGGHIPGLELPPLRTHVSAGIPGELVFEARNSDDSSVPTEVVCAHGNLVLWTDFVPARVLSVVKTPLFYAASLDDLSLIVYTPAGRRAMPTLSLDAPIAILAAASKYLMAICTNGSFYTWNVQTRTSMIPPASIASQVTGATGGISLAKIYDNGASLITFTSGTSIAWDQNLGAWVRLAELWWHQQPPPRRSSRASDPSTSPVSPSRRSTVEESPLGAALALGSLETRLHAARILGSPADYRTALMVYAGKLADDSLADRADELVRELCGPVFWDPTKFDPTPPAKWEPKVLGMNKRDLLQEVLPILARGRSLSKMAQDWQVLLARIESERDM